jgi:exodeoxyribonuclease V alpha subunit
MTDTQVSLGHTLVPPFASAVGSWPWTALDLAWLQFLKSHQATSDPLHDLLALLVSHQMGRGHACLDLDALLQDPAHLLDWTDEQTKALTQFIATSKHDEQLSDLLAMPCNPWSEAAKTMPWAMGENSPIRVSFKEDSQAQRVYLRRAWQAEQTIQASIQTRLSQNFEVPKDSEEKLNKLFGLQTNQTEATAKRPATIG